MWCPGFGARGLLYARRLLLSRLCTRQIKSESPSTSARHCSVFVLRLNHFTARLKRAGKLMTRLAQEFTSSLPELNSGPIGNCRSQQPCAQGNSGMFGKLRSLALLEANASLSQAELERKEAPRHVSGLGLLGGPLTALGCSVYLPHRSGGAGGRVCI